MDNLSISFGNPSFIDCRMASAIERPVFFAAWRTFLSSADGKASGKVSFFVEESYIDYGSCQPFLPRLGPEATGAVHDKSGINRADESPVALGAYGVYTLCAT